MEWLEKNWKNVLADNWVALVLLIPAYFWYRWSCQGRKQPCYALKSISIIETPAADPIPEISVYFHGVGDKILNVTTVFLAYWNAGKLAIRKTDFVKGDAFRIEMPAGVRVLSAQIIHVTKPTNAFECSVNRERNVVNFNYEFLSLNEGAIFKIIHDGKADQVPILKGMILDSDPLALIRSKIDLNRRKKFDKAMAALIVFLIAFAFLHIGSVWHYHLREIYNTLDSESQSHIKDRFISSTIAFSEIGIGAAIAMAIPFYYRQMPSIFKEFRQLF